MASEWQKLNKMNTILIFSHPGIGASLRKAALATLKTLPCKVITISCSQDVDPEQMVAKALKTLKNIKLEEGLIIFSDIFGATPHNIANLVAKRTAHQTLLISGINLPMLIRTLNYITLPLAAVCEKAIEGGLHGICENSGNSYDT